MLLLRAPMYKLVALALAAATLPCSAQLRLDLMPEAALVVPQQQTSAVASGTSLQGGSPLQDSGTRSFYGTSASDSTWLGSAVRMEAPRPTATGQYTKPKVIVGLPSDSMRSFMNSVGFTTERCMLPTLKARPTFSAGGDIDGGTFWVSARCTFY